jgi:uncharacterized membrane protein YqjE
VNNNLFELLKEHWDLFTLEARQEKEEGARCLTALFFGLFFLGVSFAFLQIVIMVELMHMGLTLWQSSALMMVVYAVAGFAVIKKRRRQVELGEPFQGTQQEIERSAEWMYKRFL